MSIWVELKNEESADKASEIINSCIKNFFKSSEVDPHFTAELHDNVCSHSCSSGQSLLFLNKNGNISYKKLKENWKGVAICADFTLKNPSQSYNIHKSKSYEKIEIELF